MKFNLKSFPTDAPFKRDPLEFAKGYIEEIVKWKEGFEKELREILANLDSSYDPENIDYSEYIRIKEILGE